MLYEVITEQGNFVITLGVALGTPALIGLPIATALAIFRYRLYDVDRVVNRALVYATLTSILALAYLSSVIFLQLALRVFTGEGQPQWATVISTLAAAALFLPARQRVQRVITSYSIHYTKLYDWDGRSLSGLNSSGTAPAAWTLYGSGTHQPSRPVVALDAGTAVTCEVIDRAVV